MTVIAAVAHAGHVYMMGDTQVQSGDRKYQDLTGKVFQRGPLVIGISGAMATAQAIRYGFKWPQQNDEPDDLFMRWLVPKALRRFAEEEKLFQGEDDEKHLPIDILIGYKGRVWEYDGHLCAVNCGQMGAIGSGFPAALGALLCLDKGWLPFDRLEHACRAAERVSTGVGAPFTRLSTAEQPPNP